MSYKCADFKEVRSGVTYRRLKDLLAKWEDVALKCGDDGKMDGIFMCINDIENEMTKTKA